VLIFFSFIIAHLAIWRATTATATTLLAPILRAARDIMWPNRNCARANCVVFAAFGRRALDQRAVPSIMK
jgi:hypothetical protein